MLTEQAWLIKDLLYGQKITPENFASVGTKRAILSGQDRPILPSWIANHNTGFASSCPLAEPAYNKYNRPFATNGHMVQNPPCWRASLLLFPHWDIQNKENLKLTG